MRIGIVADDLTGAADAIAPFARIGWTAAVGLPRPGRPAYEFPGMNALSLDTETRELSAEQPLVISRRTRAAARSLIRAESKLFFKKIDSTLRGHLRRELEAIRKELPNRVALICPAFPANGRVIANGVLRVHGAAWHETGYARAPGAENPVATVRAAFGYDGDDNAAALTLATMRRGVETVSTALNSLAKSGATTLFLDAETSDDLDVIAQIILAAPEQFLPVGSAGLANALAARMEPDAEGATRNAAEQKRLTNLLYTRPVLVAVGSRNPVSRQQVAFLAERAQIAPLIVPPDAARGANNPILSAVQQRFAAGQRIVLITTPEREQERATLHCLSAQFWHYAAPRSEPLPGLVVTGGDSIIQILADLAGMACGLRIAGEITPGVVGGSLFACDTRLSRHLEGLPVVLKAGGFGDETTLAACVGLS